MRGPRVEDGRAAARGDGHGAAGRDAEGARGAAPRVELVARHCFRADVGDGAVVEAVLGRAHGFPVGGALAVVEGAGEGVCGGGKGLGGVGDRIEGGTCSGLGHRPRPGRRGNRSASWWLG